MPATGQLARSLLNEGMNFFHKRKVDTTIEDRIDQLAQVVLVALLLATLGWIV
jgi:hypothetical protein